MTIYMKEFIRRDVDGRILHTFITYYEKPTRPYVKIEGGDKK